SHRILMLKIIIIDLMTVAGHHQIDPLAGHLKDITRPPAIFRSRHRAGRHLMVIILKIKTPDRYISRRLRQPETAPAGQYGAAIGGRSKRYGCSLTPPGTNLDIAVHRIS